MWKYIAVLAGVLLTGCSHSNGLDSAAPPPGTVDAYCQQDGNIISVRAPTGTGTRCTQSPRPEI